MMDKKGTAILTLAGSAGYAYLAAPTEELEATLKALHDSASTPSPLSAAQLSRARILDQKELEAKGLPAPPPGKAAFANVEPPEPAGDLEVYLIRLPNGAIEVFARRLAAHWSITLAPPALGADRHPGGGRR